VEVDMNFFTFIAILSSIAGLLALAAVVFLRVQSERSRLASERAIEYLAKLKSEEISLEDVEERLKFISVESYARDKKQRERARSALRQLAIRIAIRRTLRVEEGTREAGTITPAEGPDAEVQEQLFSLYSELTEALIKSGEYDRALDYLTRSLELWEEMKKKIPASNYEKSEERF